MDCTLHIDGGARGNPGPAAAGVVLRETATGRPLVEAGYFLGKMTNNVAEYRALVRGVELAIDAGAKRLAIRSDSELVVRQITGVYRVKSADLRPLFEKVQMLLLKVGDWQIEHVRRESNARADELANMAMDAGRDVVVTGEAGESGKSAEASGRPGEVGAFTAELTGRAGRCVAGCSTGNGYTFGATTPEGFCVFAAQAVLNDGPLQWGKSKAAGRTTCDRCGAGVKMRRLM